MALAMGRTVLGEGGRKKEEKQSLAGVHCDLTALLVGLGTGLW